MNVLGGSVGMLYRSRKLPAKNSSTQNRNFKIGAQIFAQSLIFLSGTDKVLLGVISPKSLPGEIDFV